MTPRRGFTLLELVVSIAVAGVIALLVYGSAQAGFDTKERLARHRATTEAELRARTLLADALRHASDEADPGVDAFTLVDATDGRGQSADRLTFLTRGITPPLGASSLWRVDVSMTSRGLLVRAARATGDRSTDAPTLATRSTNQPISAPIAALVPTIRALDIEVLSVAERTWMSTWATPTQLPAAVRLVFRDDAGQTMGAPLVASIGLEGAR